jgi:SPX domain protein involved in polyphosphate accumulation
MHRLQIPGAVSWCVQCSAAVETGLANSALLPNHVQEDELAEHALWCRRFASVNATGLRKIAKKHDKYAQNDAGKQFVQVQF